MKSIQQKKLQKMNNIQPYSNLYRALAYLYPEKDRSKIIAEEIGLDVLKIDFDGPADIRWYRIVKETEYQIMVQALINRAILDYPNFNFSQINYQYNKLNSKQIVWHIDGDAEKKYEEKVIEERPTFLPIDFLSKGMKAANAVVYVKRQPVTGTGFIISPISGLDCLITNNHVIETPEDAEKTEIWFDYNTNTRDFQPPISIFNLIPSSTFATDKDNDWTIVAIKGNPGADHGTLNFAKSSNLKLGDYVNIIQHPLGLAKHIALYHNIVVGLSGNFVQYLTDTDTGSSGSPVFDSEWNVVALHHGWLAKNYQGKYKSMWRNEGTHVSALREGFAKKGVPGF